MLKPVGINSAIEFDLFLPVFDVVVVAVFLSLFVVCGFVCFTAKHNVIVQNEYCSFVHFNFQSSESD